MKAALRRACAMSNVRWCSEVTRTVRIGGGEFTWKGPAKGLRGMSESEFYKNDEFHQMFDDLGLEVFLPEAVPDDATAAPGPEPTPQVKEPEPEPEPALPEIYPGFENLELNITPDSYVWRVKKMITEKTGVADTEFDLYNGDTKMEDHKMLFAYVDTFGEARLELVIRRKA
eukprot:TRINITY_DN24206_c0_g1_i1.p1 TRINITY_DN24206_c0_g1~~TRINITY_DN24206_c0_g1_i1.p1  ORF type:complete len:184 (+),score=33.47 TRINITY_DN24206_c0_g1_i1:38-553(+)